MASNGFALAEYVVPKSGHPKAISGGTIAKAPAEQGSMLNEVKRLAKNPGPEHYNQNCLSKSFTGGSRGGTFSKLTREYPKGGMKTPAVGQYDQTCPQTSPKTQGGHLPKTERGCLFFDQAVSDGKWKQSPGKYDGNKLELHRQCPTFNSTATESRNPKKSNLVGPGYYSLNHNHVEPKVPCYSGSHETANSYVEKIMNRKDKTPAPGHNGIPEAKNEDRGGRHMHANRILGDITVSPRFQQAEG